MHPYSVHFERRNKIIIGLAFMGVAMGWASDKLLSTYGISLPFYIPIGPMVFYGVLYFLFNEWGWKLPCVARTPDLNGSWDGYLTTSHNDHEEEHNITLKIWQRWNGINIALETEGSTSSSTGAVITRNNPEDVRIKYFYLNEPKPDAEDSMGLHRGTAILRLKDEGTVLEGQYYSGRNRGNYGKIRAEKTE